MAVLTVRVDTASHTACQQSDMCAQACTMALCGLTLVEQLTREERPCLVKA
jgi:hypothetical protein